jgi:two-component system, chemotaxis family, chemotaxis protein CheY
MKLCLVVDNSRVIRKVACGILEQLHFEPKEAEDTTSALDACRAYMPDAILLDVPSAAGLAFIRNLRRERGGDHPIVVLCTTENDVLRITEAMNAGADDYMLKPFDRAALADKFAQVGLM